MRILHVVGRMNRGGAETWLMHVLRNIDHSKYQSDFLVHSPDPGQYDEEIKALGGRVIPCPRPRSVLAYAARLRRILREYGPYDVVHSHVHFFSGWVLRTARSAGVPTLLAHSHSDTSHFQATAGWLRRRYLAYMRRCIERYATGGIAASEQAACALWGPNWRRDPRWRIVHCGIDLRPFTAPVDRERVRAEMGIPQGARAIGHVGSFTPAKNHAFLLEVAAEAMRRDPRVRLLLVGDGPGREEVCRQSVELGIKERITYAGSRGDVPHLLMAAVEAFLFPSLWEGLPLSVVEAQAAGLRCLCSEIVTREVATVPGAVEFLPLSAGPREWAERALALLEAPRLDPEYARAVVVESTFAIEHSVAALCQFYNGVA